MAVGALSGIGFAEPIKVTVGAYDFPPFVTWRAGHVEGVVVGLLDLFNHQQTHYRFELVETSSKRRYEDLKNGRYD